VVLDGRVDTVELSPRLRVQQDVESLGDTLEERVVVGSGGRTGLLVRVVTKDLSAVGYTDVVFGC
jgi:hypothetical protein